jgi:undecaprenyl-diphosphatase
MSGSMIAPFQAAVLGLVEGITEYLPISSTGHLVIASELLGLRSEPTLTPDQMTAIQAFEIVIQGGAILAVALLYWKYVKEIILGLLGQSDKGRKLAINIAIGTAPVLALGFLLKGIISKFLQHTIPVLISLVVGALFMIWFENRRVKNVAEPTEEFDLHGLSPKQALRIGCLQCLALWPGTSRSMVTIVGGMSFGLSRSAAAEYSFLLGLPALLAATGYKVLKDGQNLMEHVDSVSLLIGFAVATVSAAFAVKWLVGYLSRHNLKAFAFYRIAVAIAMALVIGI